MTMTQCAGGEIVVYVLSLLLSLLDDGHDDRGLEAKFGRLVPRYQSVCNSAPKSSAFSDGITCSATPLYSS
jgi:hypothetical protein